MSSFRDLFYYHSIDFDSRLNGIKINHNMKTLIVAFMLLFNYLDTLQKLNVCVYCIFGISYEILFKQTLPCHHHIPQPTSGHR